VGLHRRITLAAVLALHIALAAVLLRSSRTIRIENARDMVSTLILLPPERLQRSATTPWNGPGLRARLQTLAPVEIESGSITLPGELGPSVDWIAEARAVAAQPIALKAATSARAEAPSPPILSAPAHVAGEQYRDAEGDSIVWLTARCYLIAPAPELGAPNALARAALPRTVCPADSEAAHGDLFKALR